LQIILGSRTRRMGIHEIHAAKRVCRTAGAAKRARLDG
jgi:hypothetical protein